MARFVSTSAQNVRIKDIASFTDGVYDLELLDIINDASKEKVSDDFISAPGAFVYGLDLTVDIKKVIELGVLGFEVEIFNQNPNVKFREDTSVPRSLAARRKQAYLREFLLTAVPKPILSFNIDLNVPLPSPNFQFLSKKDSHRVTKTLISAFFDRAPLTGDNLSPARLTSVPEESMIKNQGEGLNYSEEARNSLLKEGKDPALMLSSATPICPTLTSKISRASVELNEKPPIRGLYEVR